MGTINFPHSTKKKYFNQPSQMGFVPVHSPGPELEPTQVLTVSPSASLYPSLHLNVPVVR